MSLVETGLGDQSEVRIVLPSEHRDFFVDQAGPRPHPGDSSASSKVFGRPGYQRTRQALMCQIPFRCQPGTQFIDMSSLPVDYRCCVACCGALLSTSGLL